MPQTEENIFPGFSKLKEALHLAKSSRSVKEVLDAIAVAFRPFSEETLLVKQAYIRLLKRYNDVNRELEESRNSLHEKVKQLERVTAYLDSILCNISEGIVFINKNGLITTYNLSAEKLLHHRAEDVLFKRYWDVFTDTTFGFSMKEALEGHTSSPLGYASYASEGKEEQELEISTSFVKASNKLQPGIILLIRDITERRRREEALMSPPFSYFHTFCLYLTVCQHQVDKHRYLDLQPVSLDAEGVAGLRRRVGPSPEPGTTRP